jgi:YozE SAM-like protein
MEFVEWLARQARRRDAIGDLARDTRRDGDWPPPGKISRSKLRAYLEARGAIPEALDALDAAWNEWDAARRAARA